MKNKSNYSIMIWLNNLNPYDIAMTSTSRIQTNHKNPPLYLVLIRKNDVYSNVFDEIYNYLTLKSNYRTTEKVKFYTPVC